MITLITAVKKFKLTTIQQTRLLGDINAGTVYAVSGSSGGWLVYAESIRDWLELQERLA